MIADAFTGVFFMQNQQPNYNALLNYILNPGGNTARTAQDILQGTGLQGTYNTQVGVGNAATQASQGVTDKALAGPVNGSYVNAAPMQDTQNQNMIKDSSMPVNLLLGILSQASQATQNAANNATSLGNNAANNATTNRATSLQYGENDPNQPGGAGGTTLPNGMDAIDYVKKNGGGDLLGNLSQPEQYKVAQQIVAAGGVGNYRKTTANPLSDGDRQEISGTNTTLTQINRINNQLKTSKALQSVLDNPIMNGLAKMAIDTGNQRFLGSLGLSAQDVQALGDLTALNAQGDRQLIGGRLTGYLANKLSPSMPGLDKNSKQNQQTLAVLQKNIMDSVKAYSKGKGYNHYSDIPGLNLGTFNLQAPNGHIYKGVNQQDVSEAIQNGYKEVQ